MAITIVNVKNGDQFDVFIGRRRGNKHWGNPFIMQRERDRPLVIKDFKRWLNGDKDLEEIEPERRKWIIEHVDELKDKVLGCFCRPKPCHGDVYIELLKERSKKNA